MILEESKKNVKVAGTMTPKKSSFTFKASGQAFKILSDGLYTDKHYAVIRELLCNAIDAHKEAGSTKKVDIHYPTALDETFYIRDYGTGLSQKDVLGLYTTFFDSTKTSSNDVIGAFGLGSKSPFALVDEFSVTSWFDSEKSEYLVFLDGVGCPQIQQVKVEPTTEPNGLMVSLSLDATHHNSLVTATSKMFMFKDKVNLIPNQPDVFEKYRLTTVIPNLLSVNKYDKYGSTQFEMGGVLYPLPKSFYPARPDDLGFLARNAGYIIHVPIGSLEVTPSRESLSMTDKTESKIVEIGKKCLKEAEDYLVKTLNSGKDVPVDEYPKFFSYVSIMKYASTKTTREFIKKLKNEFSLYSPQNYLTTRGTKLFNHLNAPHSRATTIALNYRGLRKSNTTKYCTMYDTAITSREKTLITYSSSGKNFNSSKLRAAIKENFPGIQATPNDSKVFDSEAYDRLRHYNSMFFVSDFNSDMEEIYKKLEKNYDIALVDIDTIVMSNYPAKPKTIPANYKPTVYQMDASGQPSKEKYSSISYYLENYTKNDSDNTIPTFYVSGVNHKIEESLAKAVSDIILTESIRDNFKGIETHLDPNRTTTNYSRVKLVYIPESREDDFKAYLKANGYNCSKLTFGKASSLVKRFRKETKQLYRKSYKHLSSSENLDYLNEYIKTYTSNVGSFSSLNEYLSKVTNSGDTFFTLNQIRGCTEGYGRSRYWRYTQKLITNFYVRNNIKKMFDIEPTQFENYLTGYQTYAQLEHPTNNLFNKKLKTELQNELLTQVKKYSSKVNLPKERKGHYVRTYF